MFRRVIFDVILFASLFFVPWYGVLILALAGVVLFRNYFEAVFLGFVIDALYSVSEPLIITGRFGVWLAFFLIAVLAKERVKEIIFIK